MTTVEVNQMLRLTGDALFDAVALQAQYFEQAEIEGVVIVLEHFLQKLLELFEGGGLGHFLELAVRRLRFGFFYGIAWLGVMCAGLFQYCRHTGDDFRRDIVRRGFDELRPAFGPVEDACLIGEHHAVCLQAQTRERHRPALAAREVAAARDRAHHRKIEAVEGGR